MTKRLHLFDQHGHYHCFHIPNAVIQHYHSEVVPGLLRSLPRVYRQEGFSELGLPAHPIHAAMIRYVIIMAKFNKTVQFTRSEDGIDPNLVHFALLADTLNQPWRDLVIDLPQRSWKFGAVHKTELVDFKRIVA